MSNTVINWRFGAWHFQVVRWGEWRAWIRQGRNPISWRWNGYHAKGAPGRLDGWSPVAIYQGRRYFALLIALLGLSIWAIAA